MPTCDVIIPAYNNSLVLPYTLGCLEAQAVPAGWRLQILLADDGSRDETVLIARQTAARLQRRGITLIVLPGNHRGAAGARNRALRASRADLVLFLGADILLRPGAIAAHLVFHTKHPQPDRGALGVIKWDPRLPPTPLMEWMMHGGQQNDIDALLGARQADARHFFYGSHVSLKRGFIGGDVFSNRYQSYGWEDLDFGRQLAKRGLLLEVLHRAVGLHRHRYRAADVFARQRSVGRGIHLYQERFAAEQITPPRFRWHWFTLFVYRVTGIRGVLCWIVRQAASQYATPRLYHIVTAGEFWMGVYSKRKLQTVK